jgi:hypothetical protein
MLQSFVCSITDSCRGQIRLLLRGWKCDGALQISASIRATGRVSFVSRMISGGEHKADKVATSKIMLGNVLLVRQTSIPVALSRHSLL